MANSKIFCNVPWFHLEIKQDGSFGLCCIQQEKNPDDLLIDPDIHNIKNLSIQEWYHSQVMKNYRMRILGDQPLIECSGCYKDEEYGNDSYRILQNWRSVLFTRDAFDDSFQQSPHYKIFQKSQSQGEYNGLPVDLHIGMGNECNLACKFCNPDTSTKVASKYKIWNLIDKPGSVRVNWMDDEQVWQRFCNELLSFKNLRSVHFLGGEPTISPRLEQFLDFFINNKKTDFAISFVTNGTKYCPDLIEKMKKFTRADIDISIESIKDNNYYLRQGLNKQLFTENVKKFLQDQDDKFHVCLKPVISALTVSTFPELIEYFFDNEIFSESNICYSPAYFQVAVIPFEIRKTYLEKYQRVLNKISSKETFSNTNLVQSRFKDTLANSLHNELMTAYNMIQQPEPENVESLQQEMVWWLSKWDKEFGHNAKDHYPEWKDFLDKYGYYA